MNKSRKGVALVMALIVVVVGGAIIAATFNFVFRYAWFSQEEKVGYVDHTMIVDTIQSAKAYIVKTNSDDAKMMHAVKLEPHQNNWNGPNPTPLFNLNDLRIDYKNNGTISFDKAVSESGVGGVGRSRITMAVYDMFFKPEWIDEDVLKNNPEQMKDFPPVFNMVGEVTGDSMTSEGEHKAPGSGSNDGFSSGDDLSPDTYGAYLIRVRLYDSRNELIRTAEEAFVQIFKD